MKIKYKVIIVAALSILVLVFMTYLVFNVAYFGYINTSQSYQINRSFDVIDFVLKNEQENLKGTAVDWAHWDDTYEFITTKNDAYVRSNLAFNTLEALDLKMMLFLDTKGDTVYENSHKLDEEIVQEIKNQLITESSLSKDLGTFKDSNDIKSGLLHANGKTFMLAISPITTSDESAKSNGYLILVREISAKLLNYIGNVANANAFFHMYSPDSKPIKKNASLLNINFKGDTSNISTQGERIIKDITGDPSIILTIYKEHSNYTNILYYFKFFIAGFLMIIGFICLIDATIVNKYILSKLSRLSRFLNTVAATKDTSLSISMPGRDEFHRFAESLNQMLSALNIAYRDIREMNERFRVIMEATNDGYLDFNILKKEIYISPEWKEMIGYTGSNGHELFLDYITKIHPDSFEDFKENYPQIMGGGSDYFQIEYGVINHLGETIWVLHRGKIVEKDAFGHPSRLVSTLTNITARKTYEEEILFLSFSDKLTGLRNRAYMEKQFEELDNSPPIDYALITGDVNGLKIANDALGHKEGDRLLIIVGTILRESCASDDIISRWGGDEFVVLVKNKSKEYVVNIIENIKAACLTVQDFHFKISIALGYARKDDLHPDTSAVMSLAEKRMYRNKLMENKSARSATINSLSRTLHEKHSETEAHTMRIRDLGLKLGKKMGLSQDQLDELELLALLHDIGKIGIPEHILMKPGKLTEDEWKIMKTHTEIGYRIATSTPELSHIADEILAHHEKYDGTGYPSGLKGEAIPILARIINIIDSYDVMTHKRVYKDASDTEYAVNELKRCAGSQFDPYITNIFLNLLQENTSTDTVPNQQII